jgi:hypothetical protein
MEPEPRRRDDNAGGNLAAAGVIYILVRMRDRISNYSSLDRSAWSACVRKPTIRLPRPPRLQNAVRHEY